MERTELTYPAGIPWNPVLSSEHIEDPAGLVQFRILPIRVDRRRFHTGQKLSPQEAFLIELQYRHGTLKRLMVLKHRFRGAASLAKKGRHSVAINYLITDDPTQREVTEHIYFPTEIDAMDFHMHLMELM